ncbi:MAG: RNA methyltransferase [Pseudomonadota bacterium]
MAHDSNRSSSGPKHKNRGKSAGSRSAGSGGGGGKSGAKRQGGKKAGGPRHHNNRADGGRHQGNQRHSGKHQDQARGFWLYGGHATAEAILNPARRIHRVVLTEAGLATIEPVLQKAAQVGLGRPHHDLLNNSQFAETITDAPGNGGIAIDVSPLQQPDLPSLLDDLPADAPAMLVVLDQVTDPHNIGAIIRSAAAFKALAVVAQDRNAPEETAVMTKIASGGMEHMPYVKVTNISRTLTWLQGHDFTTYGLDERGDASLEAMQFNGRSAIVLGAEGSGLRRLVSERCQRMISLPTHAPIQSLNVSNAAAVTLYAWSMGSAADS